MTTRKTLPVIYPYTFSVYKDILYKNVNQKITLTEHSFIRINGKDFKLKSKPKAFHYSPDPKPGDYFIEVGSHPIFGMVTKTLEALVTDQIEMEIFTPGTSLAMNTYYSQPIITVNGEVVPNLIGKQIELENGEVFPIIFKADSKSWREYYGIERSVTVLNTVSKKTFVTLESLLKVNPLLKITDAPVTEVEFKVENEKKPNSLLGQLLKGKIL